MTDGHGIGGSRHEGLVERAVVDVSRLPEHVFGHRAMTWWATAGFMLVEGTTLVVLATSYLYLRINSGAWPPRPASPPDLLVPTINLFVILGMMWPMHRASKAARAFDAGGVRRWLLVAFVLSLAVVVLRWFELTGALNVRWDSSAYGSVLWAVFVGHTLLLVTDVLETGAMLAIFLSDNLEQKHFGDVEDAAGYQYFLSIAWLLMYVLVILGPRVL